MAESKGVWYDTKASKVVESQPEEGVQLVAPGVEPTQDELNRVEVYKGGGNTDDDQTVTTKSAKK